MVLDPHGFRSATLSFIVQTHLSNLQYILLTIYFAFLMRFIHEPLSIGQHHLANRRKLLDLNELPPSEKKTLAIDFWGFRTWLRVNPDKLLMVHFFFQSFLFLLWYSRLLWKKLYTNFMPMIQCVCRSNVRILWLQHEYEQRSSSTLKLPTRQSISKVWWHDTDIKKIPIGQ